MYWRQNDLEIIEQPYSKHSTHTHTHTIRKWNTSSDVISIQQKGSFSCNAIHLAIHTRSFLKQWAWDPNELFVSVGRGGTVLIRDLAFFELLRCRRFARALWTLSHLISTASLDCHHRCLTDDETAFTVFSNLPGDLTDGTGHKRICSWGCPGLCFCWFLCPVFYLAQWHVPFSTIPYI